LFFQALASLGSTLVALVDMFSDGMMGDDERPGATGVAAALTAVVKAGEADDFFTGSSFHARACPQAET
jgi:hypothetical protein